MDEPICTRCKTDKYLNYTHFTPAWTEQRTFRVHGGSINRSVNHPAEVEYFCQSCGRENGQSVPDGWDRPVIAPDLAELHERGDWWDSPNEHTKLMPDGTTSTSVGG